MAGDQQRHKAVYGRVDQRPEGPPEEGTALDQEVGCNRLLGGKCAVYLLLDIAMLTRPSTPIPIAPAVE